jgi:alpha-1,2-mannosyltransferase
MRPRQLARLRHVLTWKRARTYSLAVGSIYVLAWAYALVNSQPPLNRGGEPLGGDYIAFYAAGRLVLAGQAASLYDRVPVAHIQDAALGGRIPGFYDAYRNPPFYALLFAPLAALELLPSAAAFALLSGGALALAVYLVLDEAPALRPRWRGLAAMVFAFPPVYFGLINGENATLSLLLYVLLYRALVRNQQGRAGLWAALGLFKPQLFFLFPLLFLVTRRWRALAAYVVIVALLAVVSAALVGLDGLAAWPRIVLDMEAGNAARNAWRMHSLKSFLEQLLSNAPWLALVLYAVLSLGLVVLLARAWARRPEPSVTLWGATCLVAVLVDPHLVDYDLTVLVGAAALIAARDVASRWVLLALGGLLMFRAGVPLGEASLQLSTVALILWWAVLVRRLRAEVVRSPV